ISPNARSVGRFCLLKILLFLPIFSVFNR
ncbi:multidrug efflux pump-associated protein, AcrZ family, partial [Salmonella enterica subsp. enterica serovar Newport]